MLSEKDRALLGSSQNKQENENASSTDKPQVEESKANSIKLKGQNKNRPPPMKFDITKRICPSLVNVGVGEEASTCPYAPDCRYRHDIVEYMKERIPDILPGGCYNYQTTGKCSRGISCLFGDEHITPEGKNMVNPTPTCPDGSNYFNFLSKDLQKSLRKKSYNFSRSENLVKEINSSKNKPQAKKDEPKLDEVVEEPSAKKICLEKTGPVTDEDIIALKPDERRKVKKLILFSNSNIISYCVMANILLLVD